MFHLTEKTEKHLDHYVACDFRKESKRHFMLQNGAN